MVKCVFCGKDEYFMKGLNLINNDGSVSYFCSSKCRKNALHLGRDRKNLKWTEAYKIKRAKEIVAEEKGIAEKAKEEKKAGEKETEVKESAKK